MDNDNSMQNAECTMRNDAGAAALADLARRISDWAAARNVPTSRLCRDYPGLGSERTFRDLRAGRTEGYDVPSQLANYRAVWAVVEELAGTAGAEERVWDDLGPVVALRRAFASVAQAAGSNRVVVVQGDSGVGKTTALRILAGRYGQGRIVAVEASDVWNDNPSCLLGEILRALGRTELPPGRADRLDEVRRALCLSRRCVAVDEAHHLGPHCLNTVKTLVNTTPGEFLLVAIPTLWNKLQARAYQEARQLTTNRLSERVRLQLTDADAARYLGKFLEGAPAAALRQAGRIVGPLARAGGNMAFVRDVARLLGDSEPTPENVARAAQTVAERR